MGIIYKLDMIFPFSWQEKNKYAPNMPQQKTNLKKFEIKKKNLWKAYHVF